MKLSTDGLDSKDRLAISEIHIEGLNEAMSFDQRMAVYDSVIKNEFDAFVAVHGCPFGQPKIERKVCKQNSGLNLKAAMA